MYKLDLHPMKIKRALSFNEALFAPTSRLWNRIIKPAESIADFRSKQTDHSDYDDGDEGDNDRILHETLPQFFWRKKHDNIPFK